jgi:hypothetical protein
MEQIRQTTEILDADKKDNTVDILIRQVETTIARDA